MYSSHPSEFPAEPLPVMIDPTLLGVSLLLLLIVGLGAFFLGRREGHKAATAPGGKHHAAIHKAIAKAAEAAMKANRNEVMAKAETLHGEIQQRLGAVLALGPTIQAASDLRHALDGQETGGGHGGGAGAHGPVIFNSGKLVMGRAGGDPPSHDEPGHSALSHEETVAAVRRAVERFNDLWSDKTARLDELRRAQIQLAPPR